ncbi:MAG: family 78 glycoside hydrolase catalytic domain, partial [Saprospiraceae bacterium]
MKFYKIVFSYIVFLFLLSNNTIAQSNSPINLRCEYKVNPNGIATPHPRMSWQLSARENERAVLQVAYQIQVAEKSNDLKTGKALLWDSGKQQSDQSIHIAYGGPKLKPKKEYHWRAKIWNNKKEESNWSEIAHWEMALLDTSEWIAQWIEPVLEERENAYNPSPLLRKEFQLNNSITKARLYITAHGLYEAFLNGKQVGDELFTPGWTSYNKRLQYQTYDVTRLLQKGENAIAVRLGDGWFRGQFDSKDRWNKVYGTKTALLFQLEITYKNGKTETIISDKNWKASTGAIVMSGIYDGGIYDARLEKTGWKEAGYNDRNWNPVRKVNHSKSRLVSTEGVPVRKMETITAKKIFRTPKGELVADLGQNLVGWVELKIKGKRGDTITLHHAEVLDQEGNFYTANLRTAGQKVQYIFKDNKEQIFEPHFTFHGFRYVKIEGVEEPISPNQITGIAIYSKKEKTGSFECSNPLINQLQQNIEWGQKGNFLDVPTDCPQRDERMGWTG